MKAFQIVEKERGALVSVADPICSNGDVLIQVRTIGLCGSDLSTYRGLNPLVSYPRIPATNSAAPLWRWVATCPPS